MKKSYLYQLFLLLVMMLSAFTGFAQAQGNTKVNIDFGPGDRKTTGWNNVSNPKTGNIANLIDDQGTSTGVSLELTVPFTNDWNLQGTTTPDPALGIPSSASSDTFFGNYKGAHKGEITSHVVLTLQKLDPSKQYSFTFFASRGSASDNRETLYTVEGLETKSAALSVSNNTSNVALIEDVAPKADGTVVIAVEAGPNNNNAQGFFYLGALQIGYIVERGPQSITVTAPNGTEEFRAGKFATIAWERNDVTSVDIDYSVDNGTNWLPIASSVPASNRTYKWIVPATVSQNALVRVSASDNSEVSDVSDKPFTIFEGTNGKSFTIVVLGSSTAAGAGPSVRDNAWVWRYTNYLAHKRSEFSIVNLAVGGYSTANIIPLGNPENNITKALSLNPDAIIINLPSNDAAVGRSVQNQMANYDIIAARAAEANVPLWVTTPQPRNLSPDKVQIQLGMIVATLGKFGQEFTVDFWTGFNTEANTMKTAYDSGDGVHMNDEAHRIMLERIVAEDISGFLERRVLSSRKDISSQVQVYPNPAINSVSVSAGSGLRLERVWLMSSTGVQVLEKKVVGTSAALDLTGLAPGLYYVQLQTDKGRIYSKLVVQ